MEYGGYIRINRYIVGCKCTSNYNMPYEEFELIDT